MKSPWASQCLLLALVACTCIRAQDFTAKCVGVTDGDTITVLVGLEEMKIRLEGIDCPEMGQDYATRAKQFSSDLVFGNQVQIRPKEKDRYGRLVARVRVDDQDVSVELVKAGLAWHYQRYSDDPVLAAAEEQARADGVGVWSLSDPIPPWELNQSERASWLRSEPQPLVGASGVVSHGNTDSRIYHSPSCRYYNCKNCTREFSSKAEAEKAGYRGCKICKP